MVHGAKDVGHCVKSPTDLGAGAEWWRLLPPVRDCLVSADEQWFCFPVCLNVVKGSAINSLQFHAPTLALFFLAK